MSRKDYVSAVRIVKNINTTKKNNQLLIDTFIEFFKQDNLKFNPSKFRKACESNT